MIVAMSDMNIATRIDSYFTNVCNFQFDHLNIIIDNTPMGKKCEKCTCLISFEGGSGFNGWSIIALYNKRKLR
jgi:hypothetical protein